MPKQSDQACWFRIISKGASRQTSAERCLHNTCRHALVSGQRIACDCSQDEVRKLTRECHQAIALGASSSVPPPLVQQVVEAWKSASQAILRADNADCCAILSSDGGRGCRTNYPDFSLHVFSHLHGLLWLWNTGILLLLKAVND